MIFINLFRNNILFSEPT